MTTATLQSGCLTVAGKPFGDSRHKGNQLKAMVVVLQADGEWQRLFVKADALPPAMLKVFLDRFDYQFAAVTEDLTTALVKSIRPVPGFRCVQYELMLLMESSCSVTAAVADNYLKAGQLEVVLTDTGIVPPYWHYQVAPEEFVSQIATSRQNEATLASMVAFYGRYGVSATTARAFIMQQAGFDLLTGNVDRKGNYANTVFTASVREGVQPLNFDYGRCFQTMYNRTADDQFQAGTLKLDADISALYLEDFFSQFGGILNGASSYRANVNFLLANGFVPFQVDPDELQRQLVESVHRISTRAPKLRHFAIMKATLIWAVLHDPSTKGLWEATSWK